MGRQYKLWHDLSGCLVAFHIDLFVWGSSWLPDKHWEDQFFSINHSLLSIGAWASAASQKIGFPGTRCSISPLMAPTRLPQPCGHGQAVCHLAVTTLGFRCLCCLAGFFPMGFMEQSSPMLLTPLQSLCVPRRGEMGCCCIYLSLGLAQVKVRII